MYVRGDPIYSGWGVLASAIVLLVVGAVTMGKEGERQ